MNVRNFSKTLAVALMFAAVAFTSTAFANDDKGVSGSGYGNISGGYSVTTGTSTGSGTSYSNASGGSATQTTVYGYGGSNQVANNGEATYSTSGVQVGLGYANTNTTGGSASHAYGSGSQYGNAVSSNTGGAAGNYSSGAAGSYTVNNTTAQGSAYVTGSYGYSQDR